MILGRANTGKAQVTDRMNPILEKNMWCSSTSFRVPEIGKSKKQAIESGFVIIVALSIDPNRKSE